MNGNRADRVVQFQALENEIGPGANRMRFGIVLLTPDDVGYSKKDGPDKAEPRARQNVVMEGIRGHCCS